jgi:hypothetical protein
VSLRLRPVAVGLRVIYLNWVEEMRDECCYVILVNFVEKLFSLVLAA